MSERLGSAPPLESELAVAQDTLGLIVGCTRRGSVKHQRLQELVKLEPYYRNSWTVTTAQPHEVEEREFNRLKKASWIAFLKVAQHFAGNPDLMEMVVGLTAREQLGGDVREADERQFIQAASATRERLVRTGRVKLRFFASDVMVKAIVAGGIQDAELYQPGNIGQVQLAEQVHELLSSGSAKDRCFRAKVGMTVLEALWNPGKGRYGKEETPRVSCRVGEVVIPFAVRSLDDHEVARYINDNYDTAIRVNGGIAWDVMPKDYFVSVEGNTRGDIWFDASYARLTRALLGVPDEVTSMFQVCGVPSFGTRRAREYKSEMIQLASDYIGCDLSFLASDQVDIQQWRES